MNSQPSDLKPVGLSTEPSCQLISSTISHLLLYIIWNRKSALGSLNQEKSKKFFLILKLEVIPHRMPLRRKNFYRKCQKDVLYTTYSHTKRIFIHGQINREGQMHLSFPAFLPNYYNESLYLKKILAWQHHYCNHLISFWIPFCGISDKHN